MPSVTYSRTTVTTPINYALWILGQVMGNNREDKTNRRDEGVEEHSKCDQMNHVRNESNNANLDIKMCYSHLHTAI